MITEEMNARLTRIGPGEPMGQLFRQYWHPIAGLAQLSEIGTRRVRLLGEDLVLFRDESGRLGLIGDRCAHRGCSLMYGIPDERGLRCAYHGWLYDVNGQCLDQPGEPATSKYRDRIKMTSYPIRELGGLLFAYLGPDEPPALPRYDLLVMKGGYRQIAYTHLPTNWLQPMENSLDPLHFEWLHGKFADYALKQRGEPVWQNVTRQHLKIGFDEFEHGIIKRRVVEGGSEDDEQWRIGHPIVFPNLLRLGGAYGFNQFQIRVPIDDENTMIWWYTCFAPAEGREYPAQTSIPVFEAPAYDEQGRLRTNSVEGQDIMAWIGQGPINDRPSEHLGTSDRGVLMYRRMLIRELAKLERGETPKNVFRGGIGDQPIELPHETKRYYKHSTNLLNDIRRHPSLEFSPDLQQLATLISDMHAEVHENFEVQAG